MRQMGHYKRELLSCLKSRIILKNKQIYLE